MFQILGDLPSWVIYGIVAAGLGGASVMVGDMLERAGFSWGRFLPVVAIVFVLGFGGEYATNQIRRLAWSAADTEQSLQDSAPQTYAMLRKEFPDDYRRLIADLTTLARNGDSSILPQRAASLMATIRQKYAVYLRSAPDEQIKNLIDLSAEFHNSFFIENGAVMCGRFAMEGGMYLLQEGLVLNYLVPLDVQVSVFFQAVAAGLKNSNSKPEALDKDWEVLANAMLENGTTEKYFLSLENPMASDPLLCPALVDLLHVAGSLEGEIGMRIRASLAVEMMSQ